MHIFVDVSKGEIQMFRDILLTYTCITYIYIYIYTMFDIWAHYTEYPFEHWTAVLQHRASPVRC